MIILKDEIKCISIEENEESLEKEFLHAETTKCLGKIVISLTRVYIYFHAMDIDIFSKAKFFVYINDRNEKIIFTRKSNFVNKNLRIVYFEVEKVDIGINVDNKHIANKLIRENIV